MADDWRVTVELHEEATTAHVLEQLRNYVEHDAERQLGGRVAVSGEGDHVFLYADSEPAAHEAQKVVDGILHDHGMHGHFATDHWHHEEEAWEPASVALPTTAAEHEAEHRKLEAEETEESEESGVAEWEVRIELASHHDARELAQQLDHEGYQVVRRWKYLLAGADDEDDANRLAAGLHDELPAGATIHVEPGSGLAWQLMPRNPFAVFGGLAA